MLNPYPAKHPHAPIEHHKAFNKTMRPGIKQVDIDYPWAPVMLPAYRVGTYGRWEVKATPVSVAPGYYVPRERNPPGFALFRKERGRTPKSPWMSFTAMEKQSHMPHIYSAHGYCVVVGLGMGMYLYNIIQKPEVTRVVVIEKDRQVIELFYKVADPETWIGWNKVSIICSDAFDHDRAGATSGPDHMYIDIWERLFDANAYLESAKLFDLYQPKNIGWWTMEGDFATWAFRQTEGECRREDFDRLYKEWAKHTALPVVCQDVPHMGSLSAAALCSSLAASLSKEDGYKAGQLHLRSMYLLGAYQGTIPNG